MQQNIILLNLSITLKMVDKCLTFAYSKSRNIPTFPISSTEVFFMIANTFIDNAKVMSKGQITIPKDIREILGKCLTFAYRKSRNIPTFLVYLAATE